MNGWLAVAGIGAVATLFLLRGGVARSLWAWVGVALLLGAAGYATQQRSALPGRPVAAETVPVVVEPGMTALRDALLGRFTGDGAYLIASDALMRSGSRDSGTRVVLLGVGHYPRSLTLWTGLGTALAQHDGGVSPAARFAFEQATRLAPLHPAPPYFEGQAYLESGDFSTARRYWARALALSPPGISYRRAIAARIASLDRMLARIEP